MDAGLVYLANFPNPCMKIINLPYFSKSNDFLPKKETRHFRPKLVHRNERVFCTPTDRGLKLQINEGCGSFLRPSIPELWRFY